MSAGNYLYIPGIPQHPLYLKPGELARGRISPDTSDPLPVYYTVVVAQGLPPNASRLLQCLWYICHMTGMGFHWSCPTGNWSHIFPFCLQKGSEEGSSCEVIDDKTEATAYSVAVLICVFGIPVLVMTPMYWKIFIVLWKSSKTSKAMQK